MDVRTIWGNRLNVLLLQRTRARSYYASRLLTNCAFLRAHAVKRSYSCSKKQRTETGWQLCNQTMIPFMVSGVVTTSMWAKDGLRWKLITITDQVAELGCRSVPHVWLCQHILTCADLCDVSVDCQSVLPWSFDLATWHLVYSGGEEMFQVS